MEGVSYAAKEDSIRPGLPVMFLEAIDTLHATIEQLEKRLEPVLIPSEPSPERMAELRSIGSPMQEHVERIQSARRRIADLYDRVEL